MLGSSGQGGAARFGEERTFGRVALDWLLFEFVAASPDHSGLAVSSFRTCSSCWYLVGLNAGLNVLTADFAEVDVWTGSVAALAAPFGGSARLET